MLKRSREILLFNKNVQRPNVFRQEVFPGQSANRREAVACRAFKLFFTRILHMTKVLCVAEKNDAAKNIARILSNGQSRLRQGPATYNKLYCFDAPILNRQSNVVFTSVSGHLTQIDFPSTMKNWSNVPIGECFTAPITSYVPTNMRSIEQQLINESRNAQVLIIWTDCDREGEHIGGEIVDVCRRTNQRIQVYRARFSEITRPAVTNALNRLVRMNDNEISAVKCRMELDLRIGAAFTRLQTLLIQNSMPVALNGARDKVVSYGSCQFPTLGFVVYRYLEHIGFTPETFWKLVGRDLDKKCDFTWARTRLFDERVVRKRRTSSHLDNHSEHEVTTMKSSTARPHKASHQLPPNRQSI